MRMPSAFDIDRTLNREREIRVPRFHPRAEAQFQTARVLHKEGKFRSGAFCYLYVILDVFRRYLVGWMLAPRETAGLAKLIESVCNHQQVSRTDSHFTQIVVLP